MNTKYLLVLILITGPGLSSPVHPPLCNPEFGPCEVGSWEIEENDCTEPNGCPVSEPPATEYQNRLSPFIHPPTTCMFCFWNMNPFYFYTF
ncbi:unnamed protein product [Macrosiphum euphorbiae]|uniref:Uncharacterized protein n=1 Tax=Macrosiphum euphorbiae TaxID=13131 RepID=A0AAV0W9U1_9HEMI|nr:unnamed protein product [Macrosiphum euphorbiae]